MTCSGDELLAEATAARSRLGAWFGAQALRSALVAAYSGGYAAA